MAKYVVRIAGQRRVVSDTFLDRAIGWINPGAYNRRMVDRVRTTALTGGYSTRKNRRQLSQWQVNDGDADAVINPDLDEIRSLSADLCRNNPLASGALKTKLTSVVGAGLHVNPTVDAEFLGLTDDQTDEIEFAMLREFRCFSESVNCDHERTSNFSSLIRQVYDGKNQRGDAFVLLPFADELPGFPFGTRVQVIEADRVSNPERRQDTTLISGGVQRTESGAFEGIHVMTRHPGSDARGALTEEWTYVPAFGVQTGRRNVLHVFDKRRPGQSRGVPDLAGVIEPLKQLGRYTQAEIDAAVIGAFFTVFIKSETGGTLAPMQPTADSGGSVADADMKLMSGGIVGLAPDESIEIANPGRPNQAFDPFLLSILRVIGVGLELPFEILVKHFTASYSAAQAALNEAWRYFNSERAMLASQFCQPVYEAVIEEAVLRGRLALPGFRDPVVRKAWLAARWVGPGRGSINPVQEVEAAVMRAEANLSTKAEETAILNGGDYDMNLRARRREVQSEQRLGVATVSSSASRPQDAGDQDEPEDETEDDLEDTDTEGGVARS